MFRQCLVTTNKEHSMPSVCLPEKNVFPMRNQVFFLTSIECEVVGIGTRVFALFMGNFKMIFLVP